MDFPVIQHWIVAVARVARLEGAESLNVASETPMAGAWSVTALAAGISEDDLAGHVAAHYRLSVADLSTADPHARKLLPSRVVHKLQVLPLRYTDRWLWVATSDPVAMEAERELAHVSGRAVHFEVASPLALSQALHATYPSSGALRHELPPLERQAKGGPHVLVVDDDADTRLLLRRALESAGFRVAEAPDGPDALTMLEEGDPFDLVTLDLQMGRMHGLQVLNVIRSRLATADLAVVVATGSDDPVVEMELFEAGADDFIVKPVDPPRFILRVQAVLRRRDPKVFGKLF
ncbi:MAG TPA: response regulator [Longimicrobiales bacterium]|nr:response regulator [Longimicrobiales bacterium]